MDNTTQRSKEELKKLLQKGEVFLSDLSYNESLSLMKKPVYDKKGNQVINTPHRTFNKQSNCFSRGNIIANTLLGFYIRPKNEVTCNGTDFAKGHLRDYDISHFKYVPHFNTFKSILSDIQSDDQTVIAYAVFHYYNEKRILHGFIFTDENYHLLNVSIINNNWKSNEIVREVTAHISISL